MRLLPLRQVEQTLLRRLALAGPGMGAGTGGMEVSHTERGRAFLKEIGINAAVRWKDAFMRTRQHNHDHNHNRDWDRESASSEDGIDWDGPDDPGVVLHACAEDMVRLWEDGFVRELLERQGLRVEEVAGLQVPSLLRCLFLA